MIYTVTKRSQNPSKVTGSAISLAGKHRLDAIDRRPDVVQESLRAYAACITHIDARIGQLIGTLRETGVLHNTWIIVTADHGDMTMDHRKRAKGTFLSGSCSVPYIVVPPVTAEGSIPPSAVGQLNQQHPVGLQDILPTCCELAGIEPLLREFQAKALIPIIKDPEAAWRSYSFGIIGPHYGVSDGQFRYQWHGETGDELLFHQHEDPKDLHDLSDHAAFSEQKAVLRQQLVQWLRDHDDIHIDDDDGSLITVPIRVIGAHQVGFDNSPWNNRGWRG